MANEQIVTDIPSQIFEKFLEELKVSGVSNEIIERLSTTLLAERNVTETAIKLAIFPNQPES
jgi:hypothetical protein